MPVDESDCEAFWVWQGDCQQWFASIEEAAKSFVLDFKRWQKTESEQA